MLRIKNPESIAGYKGAYFRKDKYIFVTYILLGAVTAIATLYAIYKTLSYIGTNLPIYAYVLLSAYILMQFTFTYGLFWMRRWLLPLLSLMMITDAVVFSALYGSAYTNHALLAAQQLLMLSIPWLFLYLTRSKLTGRTWEPIPIILYTAAFLLALVHNLQYIIINLI